MFTNIQKHKPKKKDKYLSAGHISAHSQAKFLADRTLKCRYEIKYLIDESKARAIAQFIKPYLHLDHYSKLQPNAEYPIVSLYLDSYNLRLCRESLEGHKNRFKLRIRSYTDDADCPCFFEIKRRMNTVIIKARARADRNQIPQIISGLYLPPQRYKTDKESLKQFQLYATSIAASPVIKLRYIRQAFENDSGNRVRVTFDRHLYYNVTDKPCVSFVGYGWQKQLIQGVILEIKFTNCYPAWLTRMVKYFDLHQQSFSKYANSIKKACSLGFCAPKISEGVL